MGGDGTAGIGFVGHLKQLTIWSDPNLYSFPVGSSLDQVCPDNFYHTTHFDIGPGYYWPNSATFGTDWSHVRHLPATVGDWFKLRNAGGSLFADALSGTAVSTTYAELKAYSFYFFPSVLIVTKQ